MENKLHIELLAKVTDLTPDEIQADLIKPEYETPFQVISVHSALTALQALETAMTEKHRAEVEGLKLGVELCELEAKFYRDEIEKLKQERNEANGNIESCYILHRSLQWQLNKANAEIKRLKKPVVIQGEPLRCTHEWESVEPGYTGETSRCKKCGMYE